MTDRDKLIELLDYISYGQEFSCYDFYDMSDAADSVADFLISKGVTVQGWIPVREKLPDIKKDGELLQITQTVQATDGKEFFFGHFKVCKANGAWMFVCATEDVDLCVTDEITHWMPLPEPPKEES